MLEDLPDVPPGLALIANEVSPGDTPETLQKKIVSMFPDLREQSENFIETQNSRETDRDPGNRFEVHLHGGLDPLSGMGCVALPCRLSAATRIARSVGLIADRVWLTDRFSEWIVECEEPTPDNIRFITEDFCIISQLLPLIREGIVRFRAPCIPTCKNCLDYLERQVEDISTRVTEVFSSEFALKVEPDRNYPYIDIGAVVPPIINVLFEKDLEKLPSIEEFSQSWVHSQVNSAIRLSHEAALTHGTVVSNSRAALAGLLHADGRMNDRRSIAILEDKRSFNISWVSRLDATQIVELRQEVSNALPRFREKIASAMVYDETNTDRSSNVSDVIDELREEAEEVRSELVVTQKSSSRFWKTTYGLLGLGISAYGVAADQLVAGVGGLLPVIQLMINHQTGQEKETLKHKTRPGYVLIKAQDILAHSDDHGCGA